MKCHQRAVITFPLTLWMLFKHLHWFTNDRWSHLIDEKGLKRQKKMYGYLTTCVPATNNSWSCLLYIATHKHSTYVHTITGPYVLFMFLSPLPWQIYNERQRTPWQMLVLCLNPKQSPTTAGDWPSILLYLLESRRLSDTETTRRGRGGPEEMFCPIRLMLMKPLASIRCNTWLSHMLAVSFLFVYTVILSLYWVAQSVLRNVRQGEDLFACAFLDKMCLLLLWL